MWHHQSVGTYAWCVGRDGVGVGDENASRFVLFFLPHFFILLSRHTKQMVSSVSVGMCEWWCVELNLEKISFSSPTSSHSSSPLPTSSSSPSSSLFPSWMKWQLWRWWWWWWWSSQTFITRLSTQHKWMAQSISSHYWEVWVLVGRRIDCPFVILVIVILAVITNPLPTWVGWWICWSGFVSADWTPAANGRSGNGRLLQMLSSSSQAKPSWPRPKKGHTTKHSLRFFSS